MTCRTSSRLFLAVSLGLQAVLCGAQGPAVSTAAPVSSESPLMLNISKDSRTSRVGLDYAVKWDFSDLPAFKPSLGAIYDGVKAVYSWDITENTRVNYYGVTINPWRVIISKEKIAQAAAPGGPAAEGVVSHPEPVYRKRVRLSVSPLVDEVERNFDDNLGEFLLRNSLRRASPEWEKMGEKNRKYLVKDVLSLDVWSAPVPGMEATREGLEYISKDRSPAARTQAKPAAPAGQ